jgi:hypothetical protein
MATDELRQERTLFPSDAVGVTVSPAQRLETVEQRP